MKYLAKFIDRETGQVVEPCKLISVHELREIHHVEEFGLFCSYEEFEQIAKTIIHKLTGVSG